MNPTITITDIQHGTFQAAPSLNPRFSPDRPILLASLEISWSPREPRKAVADLEANLLAFSPEFQRHQCRGMEAYHVFARKPAGREAQAPVQVPGCRGRSQPYEAGLALAHLLEHAVIDFQCEVTGESSCSGITGAHRSDPRRFDLLVECSRFATGRCCLALALDWVQDAIRGCPMGTHEREVLAALRWLHHSAPPAIFSTSLAGALGWSEQRAEVALAALQEAGYLRIVPYAVNLSGLAEYRHLPGEPARPGGNGRSRPLS